MSTDLRLVVFDLDGTLVDSQHAIVSAMQTAFQRAGLTPPHPPQVRQIVGLSLGHAMSALVPADADVGPDVLCEFYKQAFMAQRATPGHVEPLFDGAESAIEQLEAAGHLLGVATGKSRRGLLHTLDQFGLRDRFLTLQTSDDAPSKPHPAMLEQAMARCRRHAGGDDHDRRYVV